MKRTPLRRRAQLRARTPLRRTAPLERTPSMAATDSQRLAVAGGACIVCGATHGIDPAHLIPRSLGGCGDPLCVVPLCRRPCHRAYDSGDLDLLPPPRACLASPARPRRRAHRPDRRTAADQRRRRAELKRTAASGHERPVRAFELVRQQGLERRSACRALPRATVGPTDAAGEDVDRVVGTACPSCSQSLRWATPPTRTASTSNLKPSGSTTPR